MTKMTKITKTTIKNDDFIVIENFEININNDDENNNDEKY